MTGDDAGLGPVERSFGPNWLLTVPICAVFVGVVGLTGWVAVVRENRQALTGCAVVALMGLPSCAWLCSRRLRLHARGLAASSVFGRRRIRFDQASSIDFEMGRSDEGVSLRDLTLRDRHGTRIRANNWTTWRIDELVELLQARTRAGIVRQALDALRRGEEVSFGGATIRHGELRIARILGLEVLGTHTVPLASIREAAYRPDPGGLHSVLVLRLQDGRVEEHHALLRTNFHVLDEVVRGAGQSTQYQTRPGTGSGPSSTGAPPG